MDAINIQAQQIKSSSTPQRGFCLPSKRIFSFEAIQRSSFDSSLGLSRGSLAIRRFSHGSFSRHVPSRRSIDFEVSHYLATDDTKSPTSGEEDVFEDINVTPPMAYSKTLGRSNSLYRQRLACMSEGATDQSIFRTRRTAGRRTEMERTLSESNRFDVDSTFRRRVRELPRYPERTIELRNLEDNFFTHTIEWMPDGRFIFALRDHLYLCNASGTEKKLLNKCGPNQVTYNSLVASPLGGTFLAGLTGRVELWDLNTNQVISKIPHTHEVRKGTENESPEYCRMNCMAWSHADYNVFNFGCRDGQLQYYDLRTLNAGATTTVSPPAHFCAICNMKYSRSGNYLASGAIDMSLKVYDIRNPAKPFFAKFNAHSSAIRGLTWSSSLNNILVSGGGIDDKSIKVWNILSGEMVHKRVVNGQVCNLVWSPLTNEIISSQSIKGQHAVTVWEYPSFRLVGNLPGHGGRTLHLCLSPCKRYVGTGCADECLRVFKLLKSSARNSRPSSFDMMSYKRIR